MSLNLADLTGYVEQHIGEFHAKRIASFETLKLEKLLLRKNPYLFRAKHLIMPQELVRSLLDAHLSSQEETIFGDFLEGLAIFVNGKCFGGRKSSTEGIDLEFEQGAVRYIVSIKSGPHWGNSGQIKKMRESFKTASRVIRQRNGSVQVVAVNGCCYGRQGKPDKGDYFKYCGQQFWAFISGQPEFYTQIIEPISHRAKARNEDFIGRYADVWDKFTSEFISLFSVDGKIQWDIIVRMNSAMVKPKLQKSKLDII